MAMPLIRLISGAPVISASRILRNRLTLTTILAMSPFLTYGRPAFADCVASPAPSYQCSDTDTDGILINEDNAQVATLASPPFVIENGGLYITGDGDISFTDSNASSITNNDGTGLYIVSDGNVSEGVDGSLTITADSIISGTRNGIQARNLSSGNLAISVSGEVTGLDSGYSWIASDGIYALNTGQDLTITTGAQSVITGDDNAIEARNYGAGNLGIDIQGRATSSDYDAIFARNGSVYDDVPEAGDLRITIGAQAVVDGNYRGLNAQNYGTGDLSIDVDGSVTGRNRDGIQAVNEGQNLIITAGASSVIRGEGPVDSENPIQDSNGIDALNKGSGYLKITADGVVFGNINDAIFAKNYGTDLIIKTGEQSLIQGGGNGIGAYNRGIGKLEITADGVVGGYAANGDGIHAVNFDLEVQIFNPEFTRDMSITTGVASTIRGVEDGIDARNYGDGNLTITTNGEVTGKTGDGIFARNIEYDFDLGDEHYVEGKALDLTITTGPGSVVSGKRNGIYAQDTGMGNFEITVNGRVTGETRDGIYAFDGSEGSDSLIDNEDGYHFSIFTGAASVVSGYENGINAINRGNGDLTIEANGQVTGANSDGIYAFNEPFGIYDLTISTGVGSVITGIGSDGIEAVQKSGGAFKIIVEGVVTGEGGGGDKAYGFGIKSFNSDGDSTEIEIGGAGLVQGVSAGIYAKSRESQPITITNGGIVRNLSGLSDSYAIVTDGGATRIDNTGDIVGTVKFDSYNDVFNNDGLWSMTGVSDFGKFDDDEVNNGGVLIAAVAAGTVENPMLVGLERFNNSGAVSLIDGAAEDSLEISGELAGGANYASEGGRLGVDAVLGPEGHADQLLINGDVSGQTTVHVNVVGATGFNDEGIAVVRVFSGATGDGDFVLDGPLNAGFYTWDMRYDDTLNQHELFSSGVGIGAEEFGAGMTATQDLWFQTLGTVLGRQVDLRSLIGGTNVTPVADFAEPVSPTPVARVTPGFWVSGLGAYLKRDDEEDGFSLDREQTIWGGLAGFDFGTQDVGDALLFGVFGGYMTSKLKFDETHTEWNYEGPTVGVYATYLDRAFFVDVTVKADFLDIEIDPEDLAPDADDGDTDALNIGGRIDTGYKFGEAVFVEPQASFAVVHSEIDDVDVFGGTVEFDDETSVRGRLGLRVGFDHQTADATIFTGDVIASVWEDFSGDNNATIADPALPSFGVSDDPGSTMGDVSIGFGVAAPEGWSGFLRGNYQFAEDYDAYSGNAGLRYSW